MFRWGVTRATGSRPTATETCSIMNHHLNTHTSHTWPSEGCSTMMMDVVSELEERMTLDNVHVAITITCYVLYLRP